MGVETKKNNYMKIITIFILIDVFFLPNLRLVIMPISVVPLIFLFVTGKIKITKDLDYYFFITLCFVVIISSIFSFITSPHYYLGMDIWSDNIKRALQLLTSFLYYFYMKTYTEIGTIKIKKIILLFISFYLILGAICMYNVGLYASVKNFYGVFDPYLDTTYLMTYGFFYRYSYLWVDVNNAAYCFQIVTFYLLTNEKLSMNEKLYVYFSIILSLVYSMSTGAVISATIFGVLYLIVELNKIFRIRKSIGIISYKSVFGFLIFILIIMVGIFVAVRYYDNYKHIIEYSYERVSENTDGGRLSKYKFMFEYKLPKLIGEGYSLIRENMYFRPHSDHIRFIYGYGIIAYIIALFLLFRKILFNSRFLFIIPAFMAFTANSLIDEQKIFVIFLILSAITLNNISKINVVFIEK